MRAGRGETAERLRGPLLWWRESLRSPLPRPSTEFRRGRKALLFELVDSAAGAGEAFVFDEGLVDDASEVGGVGFVARGEDLVVDVAYGHRAAGLGEDVVDGVLEAGFVACEGSAGA